MTANNSPKMPPQSPSKTQTVKDHIKDKIHWQVYPAGTRVPSVRGLADQLGVSPYTVSQAYDSLVSEGVLMARQGSGYFVRPKTSSQTPAIATPAITSNVLETGWLLTHLFNDLPKTRTSGSGLLPKDWLMPQQAMRSASRKVASELGYVYEYGHLQGYIGLREQFARQLDGMKIHAHASMMVTTSGVSSGIEMLVRAICKAGDTVLVDDPTWFWIIGCLQNMGLNVIGVTRTPTGVNLDEMEHLLDIHRPRLYITNSVLHNPTSYTPTPSNVFAVLRLMEQYDCYVCEDDIYSYFHPDPTLVRYATLDGFNRVFYLGGVSKVLGGNWRVGIMVCPEAHLEAVLRQKMLTSMTCPEMTERTICHIWQDVAFTKHITQVQTRLAKAHTDLVKRLQKRGFAVDGEGNPCLFLWLDLAPFVSKQDGQKEQGEQGEKAIKTLDAAELALQAHHDGWLVAPGHLFSPTGRWKTHIRLNVTTTTEEFLDWLVGWLADSGVV